MVRVGRDLKDHLVPTPSAVTASAAPLLAGQEHVDLE